MIKEKQIQRLAADQLETELKRIRYTSLYRSVLTSTIYTLITLAAIAVLVEHCGLVFPFRS